MSFLSPWLWLGALGVLAPLWLHLREKPPRDVVPFSALRFLAEAPRPRRQPLRLRDPLLLALRALALLLVVAGFAWPYLHRRGTPISESRVHVLDNTLSHQAGGAFLRDRDRLREVLARVGPATQDAVIELGAQPRVLGGFGDRREEVQARLAALVPSFERGSYLEAFRLASALLARSLGVTKRIVVWGDGQENQWTENENTAPFLSGIEVALGEPPAVPELPNLSLTEPLAQRTFLGDAAVVDLAVQLGHQGGARAAHVAVSANGKEVLRRTVDLPKDAGALTLQARWESDPAAWVEGVVTIEGEPDALEADNRCYFAVPPVSEGRVALLAQSPYLRAALSPEIMRGRWATRAVEPWKRFEAEAELADLLVLEGSYLQSQQVRELMLRYLDGGRGVVLLVERATPLTKGVLRELGFEVLPSEEGAAPGGFRYVVGEHPIFKPFLSPDFGDLAAVRVRDYVRLRATGALPLLFSGTGDGLVFEGIRTKGRLLVFAFGFGRAQTSWPLDPTFIPFLDLCLQHVRAAGPAQTSVRPGEIHFLEAPAERKVREVALRSRGEAIVRAAVDETGHAPLRVPPVPGLYAVTYDDDPSPQQLLSVNPSPKESVLRYVAAPAAVAAWQVPASAAGATRPETEPEGPSAWPSAAEQRLWWWALAAGLALLTAEMTWLLARRTPA